PGVARNKVGHIRQQSPSQVLPAHRQGPQAAPRRNGKLESAGFRDCCGAWGQTTGGLIMFSRLRSLFLGLSKRSDLENEMADEIRFHLQTRTEDLVRSGVAEAEARRRARLEFGNPESYKEQCRQSRGLRIFDELRCDLSYALRVMRKSPSFAIVAILT